MQLYITTTQIDTTLALKAYRLYKAAQYNDAIPVLQEILDVEHKNWQARLFLAACFFQTGQMITAERAFTYVYESCTDVELRRTANLALQTLRATRTKEVDIPPEFGALAERMFVPRTQKMEAIIT